MTSRKFGLFFTPPLPTIVAYFITKALVLLSQNPWHRDVIYGRPLTASSGPVAKSSSSRDIDVTSLPCEKNIEMQEPNHTLQLSSAIVKDHSNNIAVENSCVWEQIRFLIYTFFLYYFMFQRCLKMSCLKIYTYFCHTIGEGGQKIDNWRFVRVVAKSKFIFICSMQKN